VKSQTEVTAERVILRQVTPGCEKFFAARSHLKKSPAFSHKARFPLILTFSLGEKEFLWRVVERSLIGDSIQRWNDFAFI
jgi:hypothetical protein